MKITFDTNAILSATLWDGSVAQKLLNLFIQRNDTIYTTTQILSEYQKVLKRDFDYTDEEIAKIVEKIFEFATLVKPTKNLQVVKDDPDDNTIIECAVESKSEYIITYDPHLLKLGKYENIKIVKPEEMMRIL